jgi:transcriptional regulator with XRE-family HTH domain
MTHIADNLIALRRERQLSVREAADLAGIPHASLWRAEKGYGSPSLENAQKIAKYYGRSIDELFPIQEETAA